MARRSKYASDLSKSEILQTAALRPTKRLASLLSDYRDDVLVCSNRLWMAIPGNDDADRIFRVPLQSIAGSGRTHLHRDKNWYNAWNYLLPDDLR
ncbi:hypothetical protein NHQ30_011510 [Ciborinia camelliae]|nr:hypothetical protein NHQ30_011510 [Ciborinia camelliae]